MKSNTKNENESLTVSNTYNISVSEPRSNTDTENESGIRSKQKREVYRTSEGKQDVLVYQKVFNVTGLGSENFFKYIL